MNGGEHTLPLPPLCALLVGGAGLFLGWGFGEVASPILQNAQKLVVDAPFSATPPPHSHLLPPCASAGAHSFAAYLSVMALAATSKGCPAWPLGPAAFISPMAVAFTAMASPSELCTSSRRERSALRKPRRVGAAGEGGMNCL